jgi:nitrite reductase/ring-hydroxylating ferredoxin subunit/uncharacterized membrane protein
MLNPETPFTDRPVDALAKSPALAKAADVWQPVVQAALNKLDPAIVDTLHGTPLGHPLHPLITDVPIGAWTVTAIFDALELAGTTNLADGADAALAIGIGSAALAALTGWADWSDTTGEAKSLGIAHAALNGAALTTYVAALALRRNGRREAGIGLAMLGYGFVAAAGYLGGELVFGEQLGIRHTGEALDAADHFVTVLDESKLAEGAMKRVDAHGIPVLLYRDANGVRAIGAICTHRGAPLDQGKLKDGCVQCPWHGSAFSFDGGAVARGPATFPVAVYETRIKNGKIAVRAGRSSEQ